MTSKFLDLPTELVEMIASHLAYPRGPDDDVEMSDIISLRLTCKDLYLKTLRYYSSEVFREIHIGLSFESLEWFSQWTQHKSYGHALQTLYLTNQEPTEEELDAYFCSPRHNGSWEAFKETLDRQEDFQRVISEHAYMERSGADTTMLTLALRNTPNLRDIWFMPMYRHEKSSRVNDYYSASSPSHFLAVLLAAVACSGVKLENINMEFYASPLVTKVGASIQVLNLPGPHLAAFASLRSLSLLLSTRENGFQIHQRLQCTARFLSGLSGLTYLKLGFDGWDETDEVFSFMAQLVRLQKLEEVELHSLQYTASDLRRFLLRHKDSLHKVTLSNSNLLDGTWSRIWQTVSEMPHMTGLSISYLCQNSWRTSYSRFESVSWTLPSSDPEWCVVNFNKYSVYIEPSDDMEAKLQELQERFELSSTYYHTRAPHGSWSDVPGVVPGDMTLVDLDEGSFGVSSFEAVTEDEEEDSESELE